MSHLLHEESPLYGCCFSSSWATQRGGKYEISKRKTIHSPHGSRRCLFRVGMMSAFMAPTRFLHQTLTLWPMAASSCKTTTLTQFAHPAEVPWWQAIIRFTQVPKIFTFLSLHYTIFMQFCTLSFRHAIWRFGWSPSNRSAPWVQTDARISERSWLQVRGCGEVAPGKQSSCLHTNQVSPRMRVVSFYYIVRNFSLF